MSITFELLTLSASSSLFASMFFITLSTYTAGLSDVTQLRHRSHEVELDL